MIGTKLLFFELEWAELDDDARRDAARRRPPRVRAAPPALGAPLPAAPADRARRGRAHREVGHRSRARGSACSTSRSRRSPSSSTARPTTLEAGARPVAGARSRGAPGRGRGGHRRARARAAHARVRAQHAARRQVDRRPHAPLRLVDREPQPLQRGERRVGAGARRRGAGPLRDPAALVHAQGAAARHRPARRLRPHGVGRRRRERRSAGTRPKELVLDAYGSFSGELADTARQFFDNAWIDAPARPGKRPGAFCAYTVPSHHPYLLLNWTSRRRDVLTLAHELGHGLHAYLAREQGVFHQTTPLTLAETASVFGETVTFGRLLETVTDPAERLTLLASNLEDQIATVFRQIAMNRFEHAMHTARREEGELVDRTARRAVGRLADRDARRLGRDHRRLPHVVVVHPALHRDAGLRVRVRVRPAARAVGVRAVRGGGEWLRAAATSTCCAPADRCRPRSSAQMVDVDLADPGSGTAASTSSSAGSTPRSKPRPRPGDSQ